MALLGTLLTLCIWIWVQYLPGYFVSRALIPKAQGATRHALALICGFSVLPLSLFILATSVNLPLDGPLLWIAASAINLGGLLFLVPPESWRTPDFGTRDTLSLFAVAIVCAAFLVLGFRGIDAGDALTTIQHCLYVISLHGIQNDPSLSLPLYDHLSGEFMHFLIHHDTSRLSGLAQLLYEQRIGNVPLLGPQVALYGTAGWFVASVQALVITALCIWLAAREVGAKLWSATLATIIFVWSAQVLAGYYLNENVFALAMVSFLLWSALKQSLSLPWIIICGLVAGHLIGVRHTSVLFLPAMIVALLWCSGSWRHRLLQVGLWLLCCSAAAFPWLYMNAIMLDGNPFMHPKVLVDSGGRVVENNLFGHKFLFKPLNWPATGSVVRTVWNPFPSFIWLPLLVAQAFGYIATAVGVVGGATILLKPVARRTAVILAFFAIPHWLALSWLEGMDWEQVSYILPGLAPFAVVLALGLEAMASWRKALVAVALVIAVADGAYVMRNQEFPVDTRLLDKKLWPEAPPRDAGIQKVAEQLTQFSLFPALPTFRSNGVSRMMGNLAAVGQRPSVPVVDKLPVYPSGQVVVLSAYSKRQVRSYDFEIAPRELRTAQVPVRTAVWLHTMTFRFAAERLKVHVERLEGRYSIDLKTIGQSDKEQDFTLWLNPWYPPIKSAKVTLDGKPLKGLRTLTYGGTIKDGEQMMILTNYPPEVVDLVEVPYVVESDEETHCGIWIFLSGVDGTRIETLSPGGAMDMKWNGKKEGTLVLPRNLLAEEVVLYSEPYCSDHIPQYGDRYGVFKGPFDPEHPIRIKLDQIW